MTDVSLTFRSKDTALITVNAGTQTALLGYLSLFLLVIVAVLCFTTRVFFFQVAGAIFTLLLPFAAIEVHRLTRHSVYRFEIDKRLLSVKRTDTSRSSMAKSVGEFSKVAMVSSRSPARGSPTMYKLQLLSHLGNIDLFVLFSRKETLQKGGALAAWLGIPFQDAGDMTYWSFSTEKGLFRL